MSSVLIFSGSSRAQSFNRQLARVAAKLVVAEGRTATLVDLADFNIALYNADDEVVATPPGVLQLKALMHSHPAWLICTPEYNGGLPALLKNAIDWCSSPVKADPDWSDGLKPFRGKVVGMLSASPGSLGGLRAQSHLAALLLNLQCWVAPTAYAMGRAGDAFAADGILVGEHHLRGVVGVIEQVMWAAERLTPARA